MSAPALSATRFLRFLAGPAMAGMLAMILLQESCSAATTWLVIVIAREIGGGIVSPSLFGGIVLAQTLAYLAGAASWIFAERAGFGSYSRYMLAFARHNRFRTPLLADADAREATEPFLTSEAFQVLFELVFTLQFHLHLSFQLLFNALVLGIEIDAGLPLAFAAAFVVLAALQWRLRRPLAAAWLHNQAMTNRMTARTYNAWDNVFGGNRYNFRLWHRDFRHRLQDALAAQIRAILLREGWSAVSGLIALALVLAATARVALGHAGELPLLIALAATLPRQIEMALDMHQLTAGVSDLVAAWTRVRGVCAHFIPAAAAGFDERIGFGRLQLSEAGRETACASLAAAVRTALAQPHGLVSVRGDNGSGKSTLLAALKAQLRGRAYYWPTQDRLVFAFHGTAAPATADDADDDAETLSAREEAEQRRGYSSGERQLEVLREIATRTDYAVYLLDEWDANLDAGNRERAAQLVAELARRARVIEVSHRDRK